jgi:uncharacterized protein YeaC (DUF1315 family)
MPNENFLDVLNRLKPEVVEHMQRALEVGRWDNGARLTDAQKDNCLQLVIAWQHKHQVPESERIGFIDKSDHPKFKNSAQMG